MDGLNIRLDITEERIKELNNIFEETFQNTAQCQMARKCDYL